MTAIDGEEGGSSEQAGIETEGSSRVFPDRKVNGESWESCSIHLGDGGPSDRVSKMKGETDTTRICFTGPDDDESPLILVLIPPSLAQ